jgi:arylsulfatase A-like enzyme
MLNGRRTETRGWIDDVSTDYAIEFLKKQPLDRPFFLFLGFKSTHSPRGGENLPERARRLYEGRESRPTPNLGLHAIYQTEVAARQRRKPMPETRRFEGLRNYLRHITAIDHCVGRVLDALDENGQAENTMVIVASDNGYYLGEHGLGDKRTAYEESIRVPLMIRAPGKATTQGQVCDALALNIDYAPTMLDFAGAEPIPGVHGRSLRPLLEGEPPADWRRAFLYEYFKERNFRPPTVLAVRTTTHKLITYPGHDEWTEVYDVADDPYETTNLVSDDGLVEELRREFDAEADAVGFRMPNEF